MYDPDELPFPERDLLYFTAYMARALLLIESQRESCMVTAHLVGEIYRAMGINSIPIVVGVTAMNAEALKAAEEGRRVELQSASSSKAFATTIPYDPERHSEDALQGHVALLVANRYLLDPSIDQLSRPARGLTIEPMLMEFDENVTAQQFLDGARVSFGLPDGGMLIYEPHPEDLAYLDFIDWEPIENDDRLTSVSASVAGLVGIATDTGAFPEMPSLPNSPSSTMVKLQSRLEEYAADAEQAREAIARMGWDMEEFAESMGEFAERVNRAAQAVTGLPRPGQAASGT